MSWISRIFRRGTLYNDLAEEMRLPLRQFCGLDGDGIGELMSNRRAPPFAALSS